MRQLLTIQETSDFLQIPRKSLYAQRYRGEAPGALGVRVGRFVRFRPEDLEAWLEAQLRNGSHVAGRRKSDPTASNEVDVAPTDDRQEGRGHGRQ